MTFIALFKYKKTESIFMLADGLLSSDQPDHGNFIMPGVGRAGRPRTDNGKYLHSLEQKLNVLGRDLAFAYAGDHKLGSRFGKELYALYNEPEFEFNKLKKFCDDWSNCLTEEEKTKVALVCVCRDIDTYQVWSHQMKPADGYKHFSKLLMQGSGINNFQDTIDQESDVIESEDHALGHAMNIMNKFYHDDLFVKRNYSQSFGGFYELAACTKDGIEKLTDIFISTIHIDARRLDDGFALPLTFLKHDHIDGLTVLREFKKVPEKLSDGSDILRNGHAYLPIIKDMRRTALERLKDIQAEGRFYDSEIIGDLKARHTLIMLELVDNDYKLKIPLYYRKKERDAPLAITLVDGKPEIFLSNEFLQDIQRNIEANIDREKNRLKDHLRGSLTSE